MEKSKKRVCVCTLMKWWEGLVLHGDGQAALHGSPRRVNWVKQGVFDSILFTCMSMYYDACWYQLFKYFSQHCLL